MQSVRPQDDPVSRAVLSSARSSARYPIPLIATSYDITITGGLADVSATRTFQNRELGSLEATLTFPLPVHAVLYALEARTGDRVVKAVAKPKGAARETYEDAVDRGKTTVLHEELIKGVHMLSVVQLPPGAEIAVTARFAMPLAIIAGKAFLRIPTTVGDIYGTSGLPDSDELVHGGTLLAGAVNVACDSGAPRLLNGTLENGAARVWLDAPSVVEGEGWAPRELTGRSAEGTAVTLSVKPAPAAEGSLDAAILVDRSSSMNETCTGGARVTKHAAVLLGLDAAGTDLTEGDRINLWEFNMRANDLGTARASGWRSLILLLSPPDDGTEIGRSIEKVIAERPVRDILLVTDGKSHALDVAKLAASGVRFSVVLIGEDSLEANVGHLAALTGGEIFIPSGADVSDAVRSALRAMRNPRPVPSDDRASAVEARICGMTVSASWASGSPQDPGSGAASARAAGAYAASLRLGHLKTADAAALAEREGLVTHLTSLVLVDEDGVTQASIPAARKVGLPSPAATVCLSAGPSPSAPRSVSLMLDARPSFSHGRSKMVACYKRSAPPFSYAEPAPERVTPGAYARKILESASKGDNGMKSPQPTKHQTTEAMPAAAVDASHIKSLASLVGRINWHRDGERLGEGNMLTLPADVADAIDEAAAYGAVKRAAKRLGLTPRALVIGLLARAAAGRDRYADRVARAILAKARSQLIVPVAIRLGLAGERHASP